MITSYLYVYCDLASFDCSAAKDNVKENYDKLINLPIESVVGKLHDKGVITAEEKERIDLKPATRDKMIYLLDSVINPSLLNDISIKFKGFLEVIGESGNSIMIDIAKQLGM